MDPNNLVVKLCIEGLRACGEGRTREATACFNKAWAIRQNDLDACIAAHFIAKQQKHLTATLKWNLKALAHANDLNDAFVKDFYPSLYINIADTYEKLGNKAEAKHYYDLAAETVTDTSLGSHGVILLDSIKDGQQRTQ